MNMKVNNCKSLFRDRRFTVCSCCLQFQSSVPLFYFTESRKPRDEGMVERLVYDFVNFYQVNKKNT